MINETGEILKKETAHGESDDVTTDLYLIKDREYYIVESYEWFENERTGAWRGKYKVMPKVFTDIQEAEQYFASHSEQTE